MQLPQKVYEYIRRDCSSLTYERRQYNGCNTEKTFKFSFQFKILGTTAFSVIVIILAILIYVKSGSITEETLMSIEPLGYQINTKYIMGRKSAFIPYERVQNIFINEVIYEQKIVYLLTILTNGSNGDQLIPLFIGSKPRINCLEYIFKELHKNRR